jgi:hypothetical protein
VKQVVSRKIELFLFLIRIEHSDLFSIRIISKSGFSLKDAELRSLAARYKMTQGIVDGFMSRADSNSRPGHVHSVKVCTFHNYAEYRNIVIIYVVEHNNNSFRTSVRT